MYCLLYDLPHTRFAINAICFSQDGRLLASGDDDGYLRLFDFRLGKELRKVRVVTSVTSLLWHPRKPGVIFIGDARGSVTVMNLDAERPEAYCLRTGVNAPAETLAYDTCNGYLAVAVGTDIILFNRSEDPWTFGVNFPPPPTVKAGSVNHDEFLLPLPCVLKFSNDECSLVAVYFQHGIVSWLIESLQPEWTIWPKSRRVGGACFSSDGRNAVVSNLIDGFDCYDISNGRHLANLPTPIIYNVPLPSLFIEEDQSILCGSSCGYVLLYSGNMKNILQVLRHDEHHIIQALAYCKNEARFIATASSEASSDNYVRIWRAMVVDMTAPKKISDSSRSYWSIGGILSMILMVVTIWVRCLGINVVQTSVNSYIELWHNLAGRTFESFGPTSVFTWQGSSICFRSLGVQIVFGDKHHDSEIQEL
ncbi:WD40-repeat-containing domain protein [Suillus tomentosus]|nr:WD40-repeat-containing domain protein [Suillus tomentosus]